MVANGLSVSLQELSISLDYMLICVSSRVVCGVNLFINSNSVSLTIVECIENTKRNPLWQLYQMGPNATFMEYLYLVEAPNNLVKG